MLHSNCYRHYTSSRDVPSSSSFLTSRSRVSPSPSPPLPLSLPWNFSPKLSTRFQLHCSSSSSSPPRCSKPNSSSHRRRYGGVIPSILRSLSSSADIETTLTSLCLNLTPKEQTVLLKEQTRWDLTLRVFRFFQRHHQGYSPNVIHYNIVLRALGRAAKWDELRLCWIEMSRSGVLPTNNTYGMLVDVYGRAGLVKEALLWIKHMEQRMHFPDEVTMATVVRVLKNSNEFEPADRFFKGWCEGRVVLDLDSIDDDDDDPMNLKQFLSMELFKVGARGPVERRSDSSSSPRRKPRLTSTFNALIDLYGKAGRLEDAASLFSEMLKSGVAVDTVTFNTMIHICGTHGRLSEAEALLKKMEEKGVNADTKTYNILLTLHAGSGDIEAGLRYYRKIRRVGLFPDTVTHRAVLHVLCQRKMVAEVEDVLSEMYMNSIRVDEHSVPVIMEMYVNEGMIGKAKALFERFQLDCVLSSTTLAAVIDVYAEKGLWVEAESVFYGKRRSVMNDVLVYNVMIKAYGMAKLHEKALSLFKGMKNQGTWPDECTYNSLVQMLSGADLVDEAQRVLSEMVDSGCKPGCKTFSSLIASYVRLGLMSDAVDVYEGMRKAGVKPNEVVYGSLINGFAESGMVEEAIQYFKTMEEDGVKSNQIVLTSLIKAYSKVGCLEEARRVYDEMKRDGGPDVAASNSMLSLCAELGMVSEAETIFNDLREKGTCDVITFATMMYLYKGMGMLDEAIEVAEEMRESGLLNDSVSFNQVMACYAADGQLRECCELFREMLVERKLSLDWGTFKTVFTLLKKGGVPREAVEQLQAAYNEGKPLATSAITATLFSAMGLYAYAMDSCKEVTRDEIPLEHYAYNAVIYAYGASGEVDMALKAYMRMQEKGLKPDIVTQAYLVGVYGRAGMVEGVKRVHGWITFGEIEANQSLFRAVRDAYVSANRQDLADVVKKEMSIAFEDGQEEEYSSISGEGEEEEDESEEDDEF